MENRGIIATVIIVILIVLVGSWIVRSPQGRIVRQAVNNSISNFVECERYGYVVTGEYPRQCRTPNGQVFVESALSAAISNSRATVYSSEDARVAAYPSTYSSYTASAPRAYVTFPIAKATASSSYRSPSPAPATSSSSSSTSSYQVTSDPVAYDQYQYQQYQYSYNQQAYAPGYNNCYMDPMTGSAVCQSQYQYQN